MAPAIFAGPRPGVTRRRSLDMAGFGSLLRRGSQRHSEEEQNQEPKPQQDPMTNQSERGLGGLIRRATSWRGPSTSSVSSGHSGRANSRRRQDDTDDNDDSSSGVASFLNGNQTDSKGGKSESPATIAKETAEKAPVVESTKSQPPETPSPAPLAPTTPASAPTTPADDPKKQGGIRGFFKRAASITNAVARKEQYIPPAPPPMPEPDLLPVLVLTEGNHGKVVFQNLEMIDPSFSHSELHASLSDTDRAIFVPDASNSRLNSSFHTARTSATNARDSPVDEFFLDFSEREIPTKEPAVAPAKLPAMDPTSKEFSGRLKTIFQQTGREPTGDHTTDDSSGDCSQDPVTDSEAQEEARKQLSSSIHENNHLPALVETEEEEHDDEQVESTNNAAWEETKMDEREEQNQVMAALLDVVEEYEQQEKAETCGSTSSNEESQSEDLDVYDEFPPTFVEDIQVEAQPPREYDELELFYEEQTFAHVGGSLLLGAQSELMTVVEYEDEDYSGSDYSDEEGSMDEEEEEEEEEDFNPEDHDRSDSMLMLHSFLPAVKESLEESYSSSRLGDSYNGFFEP